MSANRHDAKRDKNETEIVEALEAMGCSVDRTPGGKGRPDLTVGFRGHDIRIEVKIPGEKLNHLQKDYHRDWKGAPIYMAWSISDAIALVTQLTKRRIRECP